MNADQRFKALLLRYPAITTDFDAHGILTDEAAKRASDWAWEQLSASEREELAPQHAQQQRMEEAVRLTGRIDRREDRRWRRT
jgi:hypothetical protein